VGGGVQVDLFWRLFVEARGGVGVELVKIEPQEYTHTSPYGAVGVGARF
jgi:hypothetical protein